MRVDEVFKQAASQGTAPVSFEMFPPKGELTFSNGIRAEMERLKEEARTNGYVLSPFGRRLWIQMLAPFTPEELL